MKEIKHCMWRDGSRSCYFAMNRFDKDGSNFMKTIIKKAYHVQRSRRIGRIFRGERKAMKANIV
jgi:hypothetical protein